MLYLWSFQIAAITIDGKDTVSNRALLGKLQRLPNRNRPENITITPHAHRHQRKFEEDLAMELQKFNQDTKVVLIGDTIFSRLSKAGFLSDYNPVSLASQGYHTENMIFRLTYSNVLQLRNVPIVAIMIGTFNVGSQDLPDAVFLGIKSIIRETALRWSKKTKIVLFSVLPRASKVLNLDIVELNSLLKKDSETDKSYIYLDVFRDFFDEKSFAPVDSSFDSDRLVPSTEGMKILSDAIDPILKEFGKTASASAPAAKSSSTEIGASSPPALITPQVGGMDGETFADPNLMADPAPESESPVTVSTVTYIAPDTVVTSDVTPSDLTRPAPVDKPALSMPTLTSSPKVSSSSTDEIDIAAVSKQKYDPDFDNIDVDSPTAVSTSGSAAITTNSAGSLSSLRGVQGAVPATTTTTTTTTTATTATTATAVTSSSSDSANKSSSDIASPSSSLEKTMNDAASVPTVVSTDSLLDAKTRSSDEINTDKTGTEMMPSQDTFHRHRSKTDSSATGAELLSTAIVKSEQNSRSDNPKKSMASFTDTKKLLVDEMLVKDGDEEIILPKTTTNLTPKQASKIAKIVNERQYMLNVFFWDLMFTTMRMVY